jgi:hypothetical protein
VIGYRDEVERLTLAIQRVTRAYKRGEARSELLWLQRVEQSLHSWRFEE